METNSFFLQSSFSLHFLAATQYQGANITRRIAISKTNRVPPPRGSIDIQGIYGYTSINKMKVIAAQNKNF
jgi:hypothetical protein